VYPFGVINVSIPGNRSTLPPDDIGGMLGSILPFCRAAHVNPVPSVIYPPAER
jgi:hypothetical protein